MASIKKIKLNVKYLFVMDLSNNQPEPIISPAHVLVGNWKSTLFNRHFAGINITNLGCTFINGTLNVRYFAHIGDYRVEFLIESICAFEKSAKNNTIKSKESTLSFEITKNGEFIYREFGLAILYCLVCCDSHHNIVKRDYHEKNVYNINHLLRQNKIKYHQLESDMQEKSALSLFDLDVLIILPYKFDANKQITEQNLKKKIQKIKFQAHRKNVEFF